MIAYTRAHPTARLSTLPIVRRRWLSRSPLRPDHLAESTQSYLSTSRDPYLNLSIEHYLLQKSSPESAVLFLYVNRPSIIIGRNQNPWLEVNLSMLNQDRAHQHPVTHRPTLGTVDLVRRRSGGGTVFHDEGNVNWTVISPSAKFTRDKHAEMVVRALRSCGVERARVNERHDIVLDQGQQRSAKGDSDDMYRTPYGVEGSGDVSPKPLKVSGSAYKLTRGRALHHGTCLLASPNLSVIPRYLHSPAKPYITARGVESVSSPVGNISIGKDDFIRSVQYQFDSMYNHGAKKIALEVGDSMAELDGIKKGITELKSLEWKYQQTPQFTVNSKEALGPGLQLALSFRSAALTGGSVTVGDLDSSAAKVRQVDGESIGHRLHEVRHWEAYLGTALDGLDNPEKGRMLKWLHERFPSIMPS